MIDVIEHGWLVFLVAFVVLWLTARLGALIARRYPLAREMRSDFNVLQGAALTLLALIIGFSFAMASTRYDQRKNLEEAEANAIGTEFYRAQLLPLADAAEVRTLLKSWVDLRIEFYTATGADNVRSINERTAKLQSKLWAAVLPAASSTPTPITALAIAGMNDVLNAQGYTQAAWLNRIPPAAWYLMGAIALFCNLLLGYGLHGAVSPRRLTVILPFFTAIAFAFIADIDSPRHGIILVNPENLISLSASLPAA
jgi:hypothetical protein